MEGVGYKGVAKPWGYTDSVKLQEENAYGCNMEYRLQIVTNIGVFGKTNSGKSSFINAFTGQEVSIVADVAERQPIRYTRQWKFIRWDRARLWTRRDSMMKVRWENSAWNGRGLQPKS